MPSAPRGFAVLLLVACVFAAAPAAAGDDEFNLVIENHVFLPAELVVPADKRIKLIVENRDSTPEEFDSHALNREKVIPGKSSATIFIGPLKPGRYPFIGEFHEQTAKGVIVVN